MHEMSLAKNIVDAVTARLSSLAPDIKVKRIALRIGPLEAVVPDTLQYCFDMFADDTQLEGAELKVTVDTLEGECMDCGRVFEVEHPVFLCPNCHGNHIRLEPEPDPVIEAIDFDDPPVLSGSENV